MAVTVLPESSAEAQLRVAGGKQAFTSEQPSAWRRPADWLTLPSVAATEDKFVGLVGVTDDDTNFLALTAAVGSTSTSAVEFISTTSGSNSTDASSYTTASITLSGGRTYILSVENSHGSDASAVSSITGSAASVPTFTSRGTTLFNSNLNRVSVFTCVTTKTWTGTLTINFGGTTQTGACWSVVETRGIGNSTDDGVIQSVTGTGSSGTASVNLAALATGSPTFAVQGHASTAASAPRAGWTEIHDVTTSTPAQALQTQYLVAGETAASATFTSAAWGMIGLELRLGTYTIDWGDSVTETITTGTQANHQYAYSSLSSGTLSTRGYRQAIVTLTTNGQLTNLNLQVKHSQSGLNAYETKWLDIAVSGPSMGSLTIGGTETVRLRWLEQAHILSSIKTSFANQFERCVKLQSVSVASSATVTITQSMFSSCHSLQTVPLFDTASVTNMSNMFTSCHALQTVPAYNTASVTNMGSMFSSCYSLQTVPLFNTASVTDMGSMFQMANAGSSLQSVPLFDTASVTGMNGMFTNCSSLTTVPLFNTASVTNMNAMFQNCYSLTTIPAFNTAAVTNMGNMFSGCNALSSLPSLTTGSVTLVDTMFSNCVSLQAIPALNGTRITNATTPFNACSSLAAATWTGLRYGISYSGCSLSNNALESVFDNLGTAAGAQTVTISSNWGAPSAVSKASSGTTSGSTTVTISDTSSLSTGMEISGTGISDAVAVTLQDTGDTVTRTGHGIANGTRVGFATVNAPVSGLSAYTPYYVVNATANTFQIADTEGGSAKTITNTTTWSSSTSGSSSTDATTYATASVTLTAGRLYLLSVENSHGTSASAVSSITGSAASVPTFTSRGTTLFNSNLNRVTVLSAVPGSDWTGTLTINFGGTTQTGAAWSLVSVQGVDTATTDGVVQAVTATGNSDTASVSLAALGSARNATFGAQAHASTASSAPVGSYVEIHDVTTSTPAQALQTQYLATGDTTVSSTFTSAQWGIVGVEVKTSTADATGTVLYGTTIVSITPNTSVELSIPASATGSVTTSSALLKRSKARIRGFTVSG